MTQIEKHPSAETRVVPDERSRSLMRLERVLHEAEGETPRALVRMPDDAVKETERVKELRGALERSVAVFSLHKIKFIRVVHHIGF